MSATTSPAKVRVPLWDNARWVAMVLVVMGHGVLPMVSESDSAYGVYLTIYSFHVALFVVVAGYFSSADPPNARSLRRLWTDLILPYLIFETIWTLIDWPLRGYLALDYARASWTLWFLIALALWRVMLPYIALLRYPLLWAVLISVAVGYVDSISTTFALSRTLGMFPYFVFGYVLKQSDWGGKWMALSAPAVRRWRIAALAIFASLIALAFTLTDVWRWLRAGHFMFVADPYADFGRQEWWAGAVRLLVLLLAMGLSVVFLTLMPRRTVFFTAWGAATMYIYLLHTFFLFPFRESGMLEGPQPWWVLPSVLLYAIAVAVLLSQPFIRRVFRPLVEPKASWLFHKNSSE